MQMAHGKPVPKGLFIGIGCAVAVLLATLVVFLCLRTSPDEPASSAVATTATTTTTTTTTVPSTTETTSPPSTTTTTARKVKLDITSHKKKDVTTTEPNTVFTGTSDPTYPLTINGKAVERDASGAFSVEYELKPGVNRFTFSHKGEDTTYVVRYSYVVMQSYSPKGNGRYKSGASLAVVVTARKGSAVTATFRGQKIILKEVTADKQEEGIPQSAVFVTYSGAFALPKDNTKDLNLGAVSFAATHNGKTDTGKSGTITCLKATLPVIGEIVTYSAETFSGDTVDDDSRPTNNYLPEGTVDYVVGHTYYGEKEYLNLRCGRRVYVKTSQGVPVSKEYAGKLPDKNKLAVADFATTTRFTTLTLDTDWKAPFFLDLLPQKYTNPSKQLYTVDKVTCEYVEITFCYASAVEGTVAVPAGHPLFTRSEIRKSGGNTVLRLYLRRTGGFYGWDAEYNEKGQLVFTFLHPAQVTAADNAYGADLTGVTVLIDVGHGGSATGAGGLDRDHPEKERNLLLAKLLEQELKKTGATVILNRTTDVEIDNDTRCKQLKALKPDICIAIHHDGSTSSRTNGFGSFHSTLFSREAARYVYEATMAAGIYDSSAAGNRNRFEWHYYFVARMSDCPVVLTENGFMTSPIDHGGIVSEAINRRKAQAIAQGVADYFLSIRQEGIVIPEETTTTESTTTTTEVTTTTTGETTTTTETTTAMTEPAALPPEEES